MCKCSCHFVPAPPQRHTCGKGITLCSLQENKNRHWPESSFCQFQLCNGSCWLHLDKQQLHSGLEGICCLQVLSYSTPTGAVSGPLMETKSYWKVPPAFRRHRHTCLDIAVLAKLLIEVCLRCTSSQQFSFELYKKENKIVKCLI